MAEHGWKVVAVLNRHGPGMASYPDFSWWNLGGWLMILGVPRDRNWISWAPKIIKQKCGFMSIHCSFMYMFWISFCSWISTKSAIQRIFWLVVLDNCLSDISHDQPWDNEATWRLDTFWTWVEKQQPSLAANSGYSFTPALLIVGGISFSSRYPLFRGNAP